MYRPRKVAQSATGTAKSLKNFSMGGRYGKLGENLANAGRARVSFAGSGGGRVTDVDVFK